jgi:hypothetical protein
VATSGFEFDEPQVGFCVTALPKGCRSGFPPGDFSLLLYNILLQ